MPRFYCPVPLIAGQTLSLPDSAARHVQVLRLQPGATITLFNGQGGEWRAVVDHMGRSEVCVTVGAHDPVEREARRDVHLAVGMPANERMDWLVEKATELGAASIRPLTAQHSVLRLSGERAGKKQVHWQNIAVAACEQCGRNRVPKIHEVMDLREWLAAEHSSGHRLLLSLSDQAQPMMGPADGVAITLLSGPEGGLSPAEEAAARAAGFNPATLGPRVLRAETAPLAALCQLA